MVKNQTINSHENILESKTTRYARFKKSDNFHKDFFSLNDLKINEMVLEKTCKQNKFLLDENKNSSDFLVT